MKKKLKLIFLGLLIIFSSTNVYATEGVLVSKPKLYPATIKTPKDIKSWLQANFKYIPDKKPEDSFKTPEQTIQDKGGDCEDFAILAALILECLDYKPYITCVYGKDLAHAICFFKEKDGTWSFFSNYFYHKSSYENMFIVLSMAYPEWTSMHVCTDKGYIIFKTTREDLERSSK